MTTTNLVDVCRSIADTCYDGAREHAAENRDLLRAALAALPNEADHGPLVLVPARWVEAAAD